MLQAWKSVCWNQCKFNRLTISLAPRLGVNWFDTVVPERGSGGVWRTLEMIVGRVSYTTSSPFFHNHSHNAAICCYFQPKKLGSTLHSSSSRIENTKTTKVTWFLHLKKKHKKEKRRREKKWEMGPAQILRWTSRFRPTKDQSPQLEKSRLSDLQEIDLKNFHNWKFRKLNFNFLSF